jgi:hypothetical protein
VLTYSSWPAGALCFSEGLEGLREGRRSARGELGGAPEVHRADRMTAAVPPGAEAPVFQRPDQAPVEHYGLKGQATQAGKANEGGDAEQGHHQFKRALGQALRLRGSRDFASRDDSGAFARQLFGRLNAGRRERLAAEAALRRPRPARRPEARRRLRVKVGTGSTTRVAGTVYSVASRRLGEGVGARLDAGRVEVWYAPRRVDEMPRLRGRGPHRVASRPVIDWLVRKPGAFADYRSREGLFPSSPFRRADDALRARPPAAKSWAALGLGRFPPQVLQQARGLLEGPFVGRRENALVFGPPGSGKTHVPCAVGQELARAGRQGLFRTCGLLVQEVPAAKRDIRLARVLQKLSGYAARIVDDLGHVPQGREEMGVLFTLLAERYERGSVLLTSNLPFAGWEAVCKGPRTAAAAVDRLVPHRVIIGPNLPSYRAEQAKKAKPSRGARSSGEASSA